jgi:SpoVK/Ycf46/Vps4 family AAA+-type ATPase
MTLQLLQSNGTSKTLRGDYSLHTRMVPGIYTLSCDQNGNLIITPSQITTDRLLDLPSPEFLEIVGEVDRFLDPEMRAKYSELGFIYKRSYMIHGAPGTGKTCVVNRVAARIVELGGVVIVGSGNPSLISDFLNTMRELQPDLLTMVCIEEFDDEISNADREKKYLTLLDGQVQKDNVIYMATTNHLDRIPARLLRPGRFSSTIEMHLPTLAVRTYYLQTVFPSLPTATIDQIAERTAGLSVDSLREVVLSHVLMGKPLDEVVNRLHEIAGHTVAAPPEHPFSSLSKALRNIYTKPTDLQIAEEGVVAHEGRYEVDESDGEERQVNIQTWSR